MSERRAIIGGNWKMYKTPTEAVATAIALKANLAGTDNADVVLCPPFTSLVPVSAVIEGSNVKLGGQNLYWEDEGAFTGEISAQMLTDSGCEYVIIGHSERRHVFGENDAGINKKVGQAMKAGLKPIFCVGEKLEEKEAGKTESIVGEQVRAGLAEIVIDDASSLVLAYEPVWAIGTGVNATPEQAEDVHRFIRRLLRELYGDSIAAQLTIQYGGSVKPANAHELLSQENIDGALVGGASLDAEDFAAIVKAA
jgi:triosephosphate isomerase